MTSGQSAPRSNPWPTPGGGYHNGASGYMAPHHHMPPQGGAAQLQPQYMPQFAPPNIAQYMPAQHQSGHFSEYQAMSLRRPSSFHNGGPQAIYASPSSTMSSFAPYMTPMPPSVITQFYTPYQSIYYGPVTPRVQQQQQHVSGHYEDAETSSVKMADIQVERMVKVHPFSSLC